MTGKRRAFYAALVLLGLGLPAQADTLTIGVDFEPSIDPHFLYSANNISVSMHIYDSLVRLDGKMMPQPGLATAWKAIDDTTWEFTLREGVKFHDGSDFDAQDVIFSVNRVTALENNPNPYTPVIRSIDTMEANGNVLTIRTRHPDPLLPVTLSGLAIVSDTAAAGATPDDFRAGKASIGTGPYRFASYAPGERLELVRNDDYWGEVEPWDGVTMRLIPDNSARLIALLGGEVDVIGNIDPSSAETVRKNDKLQLATDVSARIIYLILDSVRSPTPMVTGADGKPLDRNPLADARVREAISLSINRQALVDRIMDGLAAPADMLAPEGFPGAGEPVAGTGFDIERAKQLLAEAGYPDGFTITINGPNNRYLNDARALQAVGQMLARIGLKVEVVTEPFNVYFSKIAVKPDLEDLAYSLMLMGWGHTTGDTAGFMGTVLHSYDKEAGLGTGNRSGYADPALDAMMEKAMSADIDSGRNGLLGEAMTAALGTYTTIPLFIPYAVIAARADLDVTPRADEAILATSIRPKQ